MHTVIMSARARGHAFKIFGLFMQPECLASAAAIWAESAALCGGVCACAAEAMKTRAAIERFIPASMKIPPAGPGAEHEAGIGPAASGDGGVKRVHGRIGDLAGGVDRARRARREDRIGARNVGGDDD